MAWAVARLEVVEVLPGSGRRQRCVDVGPAGLAAKLLARRRRKEPDSSTQAAAATGVGASAASRPPRYPSTSHFAVLRRWSHPDLELASAAPFCPPGPTHPSPSHVSVPRHAADATACPWSARMVVGWTGSPSSGWPSRRRRPLAYRLSTDRDRFGGCPPPPYIPLLIPSGSPVLLHSFFCPPSFMIGRSVDLDL